MCAASPALRGDAVFMRRGAAWLPLALLSEETLAYQLGMREQSTTSTSAEQLTCKTALKLAPATRSE